MVSRVCSVFEPSLEPPYDVAKIFIGPILPDDFMWEVSYSVREAQFNCFTKVPSESTKNGAGEPLELGICLRFKITRENEMYASELLSSKKYTSKSVSGQMYAKMKIEILERTKKRWRAALKQSGVRAEF